jgi:hypothetical protein
MGSLQRIAAEDWPRSLGWLVPGDNCTALGYKICERALRDIGILEVPNGSNRGTRLDAMAKRAGSPAGSWWCAIWAGIVWADAGAQVPRGFPATDEWIEHLLPGGPKAIPQPGDAILYGLRKQGPKHPSMNAHHIGIVVRVRDVAKGQTLLLTIEGNRGYAGTTNNGVAVDIGPVTRSDILGFVRPKG